MKLDLEFREGPGSCLLLGLEEEHSPVSSLEFEDIGLLLVVHGLDCESMMHADGVLQIVLWQGLLRLILILQEQTHTRQMMNTDRDDIQGVQ